MWNGKNNTSMPPMISSNAWEIQLNRIPKIDVAMNQLMICLPRVVSLCLLGLAAMPLAAEETAASHILRAYEFESQKQYAQAVDAYTAALGIQEDSPVALVRRAYCLVQQGRFKEAAEDLKVASTSVPVSISDYQTLAWLKATAPFEIVRDGVVAVTYAQKVHEEEPSPASFDILAAAYAEMGMYQKARNLVMQGLKKFPDQERAPAMRQRLALYKEMKAYRESWLEEESRELEKAIRKAR
jgi:tetratricopeptide (TPR) repeat protein